MRISFDTPCGLDRMGETLAERSVADICDMTGAPTPLEPELCNAASPDTESWVPNCNALINEDTDGFAAVAEGACAYRALCSSTTYRGDATEPPAWYTPDVPLREVG